jgi:hypothetical protein
MANLPFRALATYADSTPGATDRLLFETSGNLPRGVAPATLMAGKLENVSEDTSPTLGGALDCGTFEVFGNLSPFQTMTGPQGSAPSGRSWKITGNATSVPITNGWFAKVVNTSGTPRVITPASGSCVLTKSATTQGTATLGDDKSCVLHGDGTNLIVDGDVS